jgi:hypothetical protein
LNKFFRVAEFVILVDVSSLELIWPSDLPEWSYQSMESTPSNQSNILC